jgi:hypothetical protein
MFYIRGASFWQLNEIWRARAQAQQQQLDFTASVSSVLSSATANLGKGLASIANRRALSRVQAQIKSTIAAGLQSGGINSVPSSSTTGTSVNKTA